MRRLALVAALALPSAACFAPRPCTLALCPSRVEGEYRVTGWNRSVDSGPDSAQVPVVSDTTVKVLSGRVEFVNRRTVVAASEGAEFAFAVSTAAKHAPVVTVSAGSVTVSVASAPAVVLPSGVPYALPVR